MEAARNIEGGQPVVWIPGVTVPPGAQAEPAGPAPRPLGAPSAIDPRQIYADWFTWAQTQKLDVAHCHGVAFAATSARVAGADHTMATRTAQEVSRTSAFPASTADPATQGYAQWYAWAIMELGLAPERARVAAAAAVQAQLQGANHSQAAEYALQMLGVPARQVEERQRLTLDTLLADPALRSLLMGAAVLIINLVWPGRSLLVITPILSGIFALRCLGKGHTAIALAALGLNLLALGVGAFGFLVRLAAPH